MRLLRSFFSDHPPPTPRESIAAVFGVIPVVEHVEDSYQRWDIAGGEIDPSVIITHKVSLDEAPEAYQAFRDKKDGCIKVVIQP